METTWLEVLHCPLGKMPSHPSWKCLCQNKAASNGSFGEKGHHVFHICFTNAWEQRGSTAQQQDALIACSPSAALVELCLGTNNHQWGKKTALTHLLFGQSLRKRNRIAPLHKIQSCLFVATPELYLLQFPLSNRPHQLLCCSFSQGYGSAVIKPACNFLCCKELQLLSSFIPNCGELIHGYMETICLWRHGSAQRAQPTCKMTFNGVLRMSTKPTHDAGP